jgi:hypothetical protein
MICPQCRRWSHREGRFCPLCGYPRGAAAGLETVPRGGDSVAWDALAELWVLGLIAGGLAVLLAAAASC